MAVKQTSTNQENKKFLSENCPEIFAIQLISGQWILAICCVLLEGKLRFGQLRESLPNVTERMLTLHLKQLEANGLVNRIVYPEVPLRVEYELTENGKKLQPVIKELEKWGQQVMDSNAKKDS
ncbi:winged helix-turn-helix transcriptional regulator [Sphingobacterium sp. MYb382]|uniref:winged helix-turn-helix transcriptional regulator n=1 Tax=Sphingobacterium sp. MYb382 TaxID=2745278 RepID=UPI0030B7C238